jgi:Mn-dependent DtxR family transcriptional regulator
MPGMLMIAAVHGILSTVLGYWWSHPSGPLGPEGTSASGAISVAGFGLFVVSWLASPSHGLLYRQWMRRKLRRTVELENLVKAVEELGSGATGGALAREAGMNSGRMAGIVSRGIARGWLGREGERVVLTDEGQASARRLQRAHELWEALLQREVGLPADHVHDAAEWIEHHLKKEEIEGLEAVIEGERGSPGPG